jgi:hypothetical protein
MLAAAESVLPIASGVSPCHMHEAVTGHERTVNVPVQIVDNSRPRLSDAQPLSLGFGLVSFRESCGRNSARAALPFQ